MPIRGASDLKSLSKLTSIASFDSATDATSGSGEFVGRSALKENNLVPCLRENSADRIGDAVIGKEFKTRPPGMLGGGFTALAMTAAMACHCEEPSGDGAISIGRLSISRVRPRRAAA